MEEHFLGYLLRALDPVTQRRVENYITAHPECAEQLELLRQSLQPLELDRDDEAPPPGLAMRTLALVAEHSCRRLPQAPPEVSRSEAAGRTWWRRADVFVAASILLCLLFFTPAVLNHVRGQHQNTVCKKNLGVLGEALVRYSELHRGRFPNVAEERPPYNIAGMVIPVLYDSGVLSPDCDVRCPGDSSSPSFSLTATQIRGLPHDEFLNKAPFLSGSYGYTLGYRQEGGVQGLRRDAEEPQYLTPLMADAPLLPLSDANSGNHGGAGQNVLFMDGHVVFCTHRLVGYQRDDIYRSKTNRVEAGVNCYDAVIGQSAASP